MGPLFTFFANSSPINNCPGGSGDLLGIIPHWYEYLPLDKFCQVNIDFSKNPEQFWLLGLGIVDILLRIIGLVAIGFIIYAAYRFVLSQGEPSHIQEARDTIINALVGVVIAVSASVTVSFIANKLQASAGSAIGNQSYASLPNVNAANSSVIGLVLQIVFAVLGFIAVVMIVVAGMNMILSNGDIQKVTKSRNTIIFAAVGVVIAISAEFIVGFLLGKL